MCRATSVCPSKLKWDKFAPMGKRLPLGVNGLLATNRCDIGRGREFVEVARVFCTLLKYGSVASAHTFGLQRWCPRSHGLRATRSTESASLRKLDEVRPIRY